MELQQKLLNIPCNSFGEIVSLRRDICRVSSAKQFDTNLSPICEHLEQLDLSTDDPDGKKHFSEEVTNYPAGTINKIITSLGLILVQPCSTDRLLYVGTHLFLHCSNQETADRHEIVPLGHIDDIFGCVKEPMYSVRVTQECNNILNVGEQVYYDPNHPKTSCVNIREEECRETTHSQRYRKYYCIE